MPKTRAPHPPEVKAGVEMLYVIERRTRGECLDRFKISGSTFDRWKKKGRWDEKREDQVISIPEMVQLMKADVKRTYRAAKEEDRPLTSGERDGVFKTIKQMQQLDKGSLFSSHAIQVMDLFQAYIGEHAPDLRPPLVEHIVAFTNKLAATPLT